MSGAGFIPAAKRCQKFGCTLLAENEREVRANVVQWVENIRNTPELDPNAEERLLSVMSQLIEQKFKTLNYKELSQMLRLTPL